MCKVELGEVLSDHKLVVLEGRLQGEVNWVKGYYKINIALVMTKEGKSRIEEALNLNVPWMG
eukprot:c32073_g1_i1 orf=50-235(+)